MNYLLGQIAFRRRRVPLDFIDRPMEGGGGGEGRRGKAVATAIVYLINKSIS